jgi:uncharacterized protein (TIGR02646 family)
MRPVKKWPIGYIHPNPAFTVSPNYDPWSSAKDHLEENIGSYCSYCEKVIEDEAAHIEHVQSKAAHLYPHLQFSWSNFLFSCQRCNGTDNKGVKDVVLGAVHLPHQNNTYMSISYGIDGLVTVNPTLNGLSMKHAVELIELVGLHKRPGILGYKPADKRWTRRRTTYRIAEEKLKQFNAGNINVQTIVDLALARGYFSIWFTLFRDHPIVRQALINSFPGTDSSCFDPINDYNPINRNPLIIADPI